PGARQATRGVVDEARPARAGRGARHPRPGAAGGRRRPPARRCRPRVAVGLLGRSGPGPGGGRKPVTAHELPTPETVYGRRQAQVIAARRAHTTEQAGEPTPPPGLDPDDIYARRRPAD